jgi:hypothetical protein
MSRDSLYKRPNKSPNGLPKNLARYLCMWANSDTVTEFEFEWLMMMQEFLVCVCVCPCHSISVQTYLFCEFLSIYYMYVNIITITAHRWGQNPHCRRSLCFSHTDRGKPRTTTIIMSKERHNPIGKIAQSFKVKNFFSSSCITAVQIVVYPHEYKLW